MSRRLRYRPVRLDPDATRAALATSALTLFDKQGYDATSVQQIVRRGLDTGVFRAVGSAR